MNRIATLFIVALGAVTVSSAVQAQGCGQPHTQDQIHVHVPHSLAQRDPNYCGPFEASVLIYNPPGNPNARVEFEVSTQDGTVNDPFVFSCNRHDRVFNAFCSETFGVADLAGGEARSFNVAVPKMLRQDFQIEVRYFLVAASERGVQVTVSYLNDCTRVDGSVPPNWQATMSNPQPIPRDGCR